MARSARPVVIPLTDVTEEIGEYISSFHPLAWLEAVVSGELTLSPVKGSARRYRIGATEATLPRRRVEKIRRTTGQYTQRPPRTAPPKPRKPRKPRKPQNKNAVPYRTLVRSWKEQNPANRVRGNSQSAQEFKRLLRDLKNPYNAARGKKAKALVKLGLRQPEWTHPVGETPDIRKKKTA